MFSHLKDATAALAARAGLMLRRSLPDDEITSDVIVVHKPQATGPSAPAPGAYDPARREAVTSPPDPPRPSLMRSMMSRFHGTRRAACNGLPMAHGAPPRRMVHRPFSGAELRFIRAEGQAAEIARRLRRLKRAILHAPPGSLALAALVPTLAFALCGLADWRMTW